MSFPFEIHVTIEPNVRDIAYFKKHCQWLGNVKALTFDLYNRSHEESWVDCLTSSKISGNLVGAQAERDRIYAGLEMYGYTITRNKIEVGWWYFTDVQNDVLQDGQYFESHVAFFVTERDISLLWLLVKERKAYISRSGLKYSVNGFDEYTITLRNHTDFNEFRKERKQFVQDAKDLGLSPQPDVIEFVVYDSNIQHDLKWTT